jgi:hypothetical protein
MKFFINLTNKPKKNIGIILFLLFLLLMLLGWIVDIIMDSDVLPLIVFIYAVIAFIAEINILRRGLIKLIRRNGNSMQQAILSRDPFVINRGFDRFFTWCSYIASPAYIIWYIITHLLN